MLYCSITEFLIETVYKKNQSARPLRPYCTAIVSPTYMDCHENQTEKIMKLFDRLRMENTENDAWSSIMTMDCDVGVGEKNHGHGYQS